MFKNAELKVIEEAETEEPVVNDPNPGDLMYAGAYVCVRAGGFLRGAAKYYRKKIDVPLL
jgi:hypothetical protein